jgi:uncharacterized protein (DUF927 family)
MTVETGHLHVVNGSGERSKRKARHSPSIGLSDIRRRPDGCLEYRAADGDAAPGRWLLLSSPIYVRALTRDQDGKNWGRLVEVHNPDGGVNRWAMPAALLASSRGERYREVLMSLGCHIEPGVRAGQALHRYLSATVELDGAPLPRAIAAGRTGWHGRAFVLPGGGLGGAERVVYQSTSEIRAAIRTAGTLEEWREIVAKPAAGNSRVVLAISAAFAAPLLAPLQLEGAGIHLRGGSSEGKTTAIVVAGSVWGGGGLNGYKQSWQATANGVEAMAEAHCDLPLCLDEMGLVQAEDAARIAYQLASGIGRQRALANGMGAPRREWRVFVLSTGEMSLADKLRECRTPQRIMAGQEVRLIDLPADAGKGFGLFDAPPEVPGRPNGGTPKDRGAALARALNDAAGSCYGTAGPAFLAGFLADRDDSVAKAREVIEAFVAKYASGAHGQVQRVARTFALIAAAGELAVAFGVVPWTPGEATRGAGTCLAAWLGHRGNDGAAEIIDAMALLRTTVERDAVRFQKIGSTEPVRDRLGFLRAADDGSDTEYLILPQMWRALMAGRDPRRIAHEFAGRGILKRDSEGRPDRKERLPGANKTQRVFVVSHNVLFDDEADDA